MNEPAFKASRQKVERAKRHLAELKNNTDEFIQSKWHDTQIKINEAGQKHFEVRILGQPKDYSVILGDIVHNLRTALDLMAVEIVESNGSSSNGVLFPFCNVPDDLDKIIKKRNFHRAPTAAIEELRRLKPFRGGNIALRAIHDLDIQDKHKTLIPAARIVTLPLEIVHDEHGHPVGFSEGKLQIEMRGPPSIVYQFPQDSPLTGEPIIPTLHELVELVSGILDTFEAIIS